MLNIADPGAVTRVAGLTRTLARPADIFIDEATAGCQAALDVSVPSPAVATAGPDAVLKRHNKKADKYAPDREILREANIGYMPIVWSADGRPHPAVQRAMRFTAERAERIVIGGTPGGVTNRLRRWKH